MTKETKEIKEQKESKYFEAVGRRKTAIARVRVYVKKEPRSFLINNLPPNDYWKNERQKAESLAPLIKAGLEKTATVSARVKGGGLDAQAGAVSLGLARALVKLDSSLRPLLRSVGLLTRDSRMVERKKYGLKKARRAPQWAKR